MYTTPLLARLILQLTCGIQLVIASLLLLLASLVKLLVGVHVSYLMKNLAKQIKNVEILRQGVYVSRFESSLIQNPEIFKKLNQFKIFK